MSRHHLVLGFLVLVAAVSLGVPIASRAKSRSEIREAFALLQAEGVETDFSEASVQGSFGKPLISPLVTPVEMLDSNTKQLLVIRSANPFDYSNPGGVTVDIRAFKDVLVTKEVRAIAKDVDLVAEANSWDNINDNWKALTVSTPVAPLADVIRLRNGVALIDGLQGRSSQAIAGLKVVEHSADLLAREPGSDHVRCGVELKTRVRTSLRALLMAEKNPAAKKAYIEFARGLKHEQYALHLLSTEFIALSRLLASGEPLKDYQTSGTAYEVSESHLLSGGIREAALLNLADCFTETAKRCNDAGDVGLVPELSACAGSLSKQKDAGAQLALTILPRFGHGSDPFRDLAQADAELKKLLELAQ